ncbi:MAG: hypothetical protein R3291_01970 [Thermoplasmata archaeon]|nr:hypothetical protein [Thermoplasmata archaeon]
MNHEFFAAGAVGIGPAFLLMFYTLRRYEYPYVEKALFRNERLFLSFAIGLVVGVVTAVVFNAFLVGTTVEALLALLAVAVFEESFKLVYLNYKIFRGNFDTVFYGPGLSFGIAATFSMAFAFQVFTQPEVPLGALIVNVTVLILLAVGLNALHFYTGAVQGAGAGRGRPWRAYFQALGARGVFALLLAPFLAPFQVLNPAVLVGFLLVAVGFALFLFWNAYTRVIPNSLPSEVRRRLRRRPASEEA